MKKDWEIKKLGELTLDKMSYGTSSPSCEYDGETRYIRITDINDNGELNEDFVSPISYEEKHVLQDGDIVFARTGATVGKAYCYHSSNAKYVYAGYLIRLRPNKKIVLPDYIFYYTKSKNYLDFIRTSQVAAAQPNVNAEKYSNLEIPVPPLEEQKRIVKILDEKFAQLESLKATAQTNLQNAKDLFQSQLAKAFSNTTWEKKRLGDSSELITKGSSPKWQGINYVTDDGILFVTSENVRENYIDLDKSKYLEKKFNDKQKRSILKKNDVLVNIVGASIGRAAIFDFDIIDANINQAVALIRSKNEIDVHFLSYFLNSDNAMNQYNNAKKDTARANLSLEDINNLRIPLPPLPEQKRIVKELDTLSEKVRQLQEIYTKQIANCDELKQSYLQKAFEGEM